MVAPMQQIDDRLFMAGVCNMALPKTKKMKDRRKRLKKSAGTSKGMIKTSNLVHLTRVGLPVLPIRPLILRTPLEALLLSVTRRGLVRTLVTEMAPLPLLLLRGVFGAACPASPQFSLSSWMSSVNV